MKDKLRVAAFGAHPDDIEASMAGTLLKYKQQGHEVFAIIMTDGRRGGSNPGMELAEIRRKEAIAAASHLGIEPIFMNFEDGRLIYSSETRERVEEVYAKIKPDLVFTHDPDDYHSDHRATSKLVNDTAWTPVFFADTLHCVGFTPQFYVDISEQFEQKIKMLSEHKSQEQDGALIESVQVQNRLRGMQCDWYKVKYAEAFRLYPRGCYMAGHNLLIK